MERKNFIIEDLSTRQRIKQMGFHDSTIVDAGSIYIVEGDIVFSKGNTAFLADSTNAKSGRKQQWELGSRIAFAKQVAYRSPGNGFLAGQLWQSDGTNYAVYQFGVGDVHRDGPADVIGIDAGDEEITVWQSLFIYY